MMFDVSKNIIILLLENHLSLILRWFFSLLNLSVSDYRSGLIKNRTLKSCVKN